MGRKLTASGYPHYSRYAFDDPQPTSTTPSCGQGHERSAHTPDHTFDQLTIVCFAAQWVAMTSVC